MSDQPSQFANSNFPWSSEPQGPDEPLTPIHAATQRALDEQTPPTALPAYDSLSTTSVLPTVAPVSDYSSPRYSSLAAEAQNQFTYDTGATYGSGSSSTYDAGGSYGSGATRGYDAPPVPAASTSLGYEPVASATYDSGRSYSESPAAPKYGESEEFIQRQTFDNHYAAEPMGLANEVTAPHGDHYADPHTQPHTQPHAQYHAGLAGLAAPADPPVPAADPLVPAAPVGGRPRTLGSTLSAGAKLSGARPSGAPSDGNGGAMVSSARQAAGDGASVVSALFDFSFTSLVTPKLVRFVYLLSTIGLVLVWVFFLFSAFAASAGFGLVVLVLGPIVLLVYLALIRMTLEFFLSVTRMADDINRRLPQA